MDLLSKDMIEQWIIPHLSKGARGPQPAVKLVDRVRAILPRLKNRHTVAVFARQCVL
ncbi:MAG: hypothetical protein M3342_16190 [Bacteroidota bacterium]|nr:hypothetical protein [Bacteroidota bacterium]